MSMAFSCQTTSALIQLNKYINGRLKHNLDLELQFPEETTIPPGHFGFTTLDGYVYDVWYWNEGNGILRYDYIRTKTKEREVADAVVFAIGIVAIIVSSPFGFGVPASF